MPFEVLGRIPQHGLKAYVTISFGFLHTAILYAVKSTKDPAWRIKYNKLETSTQRNVTRNDVFSWNSRQYVSETGYYLQEIFYFMLQEPPCVWALINMAYCCLILLGAFMKKLVFGELRVSERQHVKDKFWNFVFYKFIFVFGVINVQFMDEVVLWCAWFSVLGFLHLLAQLCKDRFEYLSFSPTTPFWTHLRLLGLLTIIFMISAFMFLVCVGVGFFAGFNTFAFMAAECIQLNIRTLHVILRYMLHLYDIRQGEATSSSSLEKRGSVSYYIQFIFELAVLTLDFAHHLHMLFWSNIFLSMASLVICMQLRYLFHEIQRRVKKHRNYLWVLNHMEQNYPMAEVETLTDNEDNCAICWEKMESARRLPCSHLFHNSCLQSWLEQDTSCPTCRMVLSIHNPASMDLAARLEHTVDNIGDNQQANRRAANHFFHFDGSRYVSWLPSFIVEVTHTHLRVDQQVAQTSQLDVMARQIEQLFPHLPLAVIIDDLRLTRSVELTVENILDGRVVTPHHLLYSTTQQPETTTNNNTLTMSTSPGTSSSAVASDDDLKYTSQDSQDSEEPVPIPVHFSKLPSERERILQKRKDDLILKARRRYLERSQTSQ